MLKHILWYIHSLLRTNLTKNVLGYGFRTCSGMCSECIPNAVGTQFERVRIRSCCYHDQILS